MSDPCSCGCGQPTSGRKKHVNGAHKQRAYRARQRERANAPNAARLAAWTQGDRGDFADLIEYERESASSCAIRPRRSAREITRAEDIIWAGRVRSVGDKGPRLQAEDAAEIDALIRNRRPGDETEDESWRRHQIPHDPDHVGMWGAWDDTYAAWQDARSYPLGLQPFTDDRGRLESALRRVDGLMQPAERNLRGVELLAPAERAAKAPAEVVSLDEFRERELDELERAA